MIDGDNEAVKSRSFWDQASEIDACVCVSELETRAHCTEIQNLALLHFWFQVAMFTHSSRKVQQK